MKWVGEQDQCNMPGDVIGQGLGVVGLGFRDLGLGFLPYHKP